MGVIWFIYASNMSLSLYFHRFYMDYKGGRWVVPLFPQNIFFVFFLCEKNSKKMYYDYIHFSVRQSHQSRHMSITRGYTRKFFTPWGHIYTPHTLKKTPRQLVFTLMAVVEPLAFAPISPHCQLNSVTVASCLPHNKGLAECYHVEPTRWAVVVCGC